MSPEDKARMMAELQALDPGPPAESATAAPDAYVQQPGQAQWQVARDAGIAQRRRSLEEAAMDREIQQNREVAAREQMNRGMAREGFLAPGSEHLKPGEYGGPPAQQGGEPSFEDRMGRLSSMLGGFSQQSAPRDTRYVSSPAGRKQNIRPADNSQVYEALSNSDYEYKDPGAPGAGDGTFNGPMAEELSAIPGVVAPGPDGFDRVDTGRLTMANASETGKLRREMDELRQRLAALDSPDAVLSEVNKPAPKAPRRGTTANVDMGEIAYETDPSFDGDWSSLESAGRNEQAIMRAEMEGRRNQGVRNELDQYREWGIAEQPVSAGDDLQFKKGVSPYDTEFSRDPMSFGSTILSPQSDAEQAARLRQQYATVTGERPADDFDSRHRQDVIAQGNSRGVDGTGPARAAAVDEYIAGLGISGPVSRESAAQLARQMNTEHATGRLISNIQPGEILEALRRRTEMAL